MEHLHCCSDFVMHTNVMKFNRFLFDWVAGICCKKKQHFLGLCRLEICLNLLKVENVGNSFCG